MSQARVLNVKFGKATSTSDLTSTPGTLVQLTPDGEPSFRLAERKKLMRGGVNAAGRYLSPLAGPLALGEYGVDFILRGLSGNTGGAILSASTSEVGLLLDVLTGTAAVDPSGAVTGATGGSTTSVTVTSGVNIPTGMGILFSNGTDFVAREVTAGGGTGTLTIDRNSGGTPVGNVIRAAKWTIDPTISNHTHGYFDVEGEDWRGLFTGCMGTAKLTAAMGEYVKLQTSWKATDVNRAAEANPAFTDVVAGSAITSVNSSFWVGNTAYTFRDLAVDFGGSVTARQSQNSTQGVYGYGVFEKLPKITGKLYLETIAGLGGHDDNTTSPLSTTIAQGRNAALGAAVSTFDVGIQLGNAAAGCAYLRAPAAAFTKYERVNIDGFEGFDFELTCFGPTSGSPLRIHLF